MHAAEVTTMQNNGTDVTANTFTSQRSSAAAASVQRRPSHHAPIARSEPRARRIVLTRPDPTEAQQRSTAACRRILHIHNPSGPGSAMCSQTGIASGIGMEWPIVTQTTATEAHAMAAAAIRPAENETSSKLLESRCFANPFLLSLRRPPFVADPMFQTRLPSPFGLPGNVNQLRPGAFPQCFCGASACSRSGLTPHVFGRNSPGHRNVLSAKNHSDM
jgi:hypothetical protein